MNKFYPTIEQSFGILGILLLMSLLSGFIALLFNGLQMVFPNAVYLTSLGYMVAYALSFGLTIRYAKRKITNEYNQPFSWDFNNIPWVIYVVAIAIGLTNSAITEPLTSLIPMPAWAKELFESMLTNDAFAFITVVILAPVLEEVIFRGIILKGFLKNYNPTKAIIVSALLFGLFHLNPWQAIGASFVGVILGWVYYKTKSIVPCIIIHFVNNLLAFILFNHTNDADGTIMEMFSSTSLYLVFYFATIAITTIGLLIIAKKQETINPD